MRNIAAGKTSMILSSRFVSLIMDEELRFDEVYFSIFIQPERD